MVIFITGSTGTLGKELVDLFFTKTDAKLYMLVHKTTPSLDSRYKRRIVMLRGDITKKNLGLSHSQIKKLSSQVTHIIHSAAITKFNLPLKGARLVNSSGTRHVLKLAIKLPYLIQFAFISSVYVSGKQTGTIYETVSSQAPIFVNSYEQSKYEAEKLILKYQNQIPISIYRLSTIIGHSKTGVVSHFTAPHQAFRMMYLGLASMVPGSPGFKVDLIPSDYAGEVVFWLFIKHFQPSKIFHITSTPSKSFNLQSVIDNTFDNFSRLDKNWLKKNYPQPSIVTVNTFDLFTETAHEANNPLIFNALTALRFFAPQLGFPKDFDKTNLIMSLPDYENKLPHINTYFDKVVKYCFDTHWGKI